MESALLLPARSNLADHPEAIKAKELKDATLRLGMRTGNDEQLLSSLPFFCSDITAGSETELQVAVAGSRSDVDLPLTIEASSYFENLLRRARSGDSTDRPLHALEEFLANNRKDIWENSGVRFPYHLLHGYARQAFQIDLRADKENPRSGKRSDLSRFLTGPEGEQVVRVPISYLIKLALADLVGSQKELPVSIRQTGQQLMAHYLNDNTSPETFSFHVVPMRPDAGMGKELARETAKRFLLTSLLVNYANRRFGLTESGQNAMIYFAPHPPLRQKALNNIIPDSFYRDLYMSPCLSGWQHGEQKHHYMHLCHQVLSRSQINAVAKLREAGIITNNLVVLPPLSNISLANNGTHISLGSQRLGALLKDANSGFDARHEKVLGDLVIKIAEHFLPLFVGTYSAAPYRLGFNDFHPETALGFLPHELDYTHLRMLWRRWRKKADLSVFGRSVTPFGPTWFDHGFSRLFNLKGDFVPDFRLLDYPVSFLSTNRSPALDGRIGNQERLKEDLANMGISDKQMSLYMFLKPREFNTMGYSGVEGRHYSVFENFGRDLGNAASIQALVIAFAYKLVVTGCVTHADIPDDPVVESERRQIFFGAAINLPTFFVRHDSGNRFLQKIFARAGRTRNSHRYPGYSRVYNTEYRHALVEMLQDEAPELIDAMNQRYNLEDLKLRLDFPTECAASGKLTKAILERLNAKDPMKVPAEQFNQAAEDHYRETLKQAHMVEALEYLERDLQRLDQAACIGDHSMLEALQYNLNGQSASAFLKNVKRDLLADEIDTEALQRLINLLIFTIHRDQARADRVLQNNKASDEPATPIYRAG
ncbi:MAG: hypothetical protein RQ754_15955 [Desulfuromonadales bacterium]|nr:hypothetical protein [Desulfuromonadales bacterium]